jgi:hypothetical protein
MILKLLEEEDRRATDLLQRREEEEDGRLAAASAAAAAGRWCSLVNWRSAMFQAREFPLQRGGGKAEGRSGAKVPKKQQINRNRLFFRPMYMNTNLLIVWVMLAQVI